MRQPAARGRRPPGPAIAPARGADDAVRQAFAHRFVEAQYAWTGMLLDHLILCRRRLGDLDAVLVLGVLGLSALGSARRELRQDAAGETPDYYADKVPPGSGINVQSLADVTGIPRETVRRKLGLLAEAGLIERLPGGAWCLAAGKAGGSHARVALQDVTESAVQDLARLFARLAALADEAGRDGAAPRR